VILDDDGKRSLLTRSAEGNHHAEAQQQFQVEPSSIAFHDVNHDGLNDLIVLIPYEKIKILLQQPTNRSRNRRRPPGGTSEQPWMSVADVDGDGRTELLLAQKNFLRAVVLKSDPDPLNGTNKTWLFTVKDQINGAASNSRIVGAAPLRNGTNRIVSLSLFDAERKAVTLSERDTNGVWQVIRNLPLPYTDFTELRPVAIGGTKSNSVAFLGLGAVGWSALDGETWEFVELDGYETPIKDGRLHDVVSGDLNQDGRKDLVFLETGKNYLDLVIFSSAGKLVPANRWQVSKNALLDAARASEPREAAIVDITGDGRTTSSCSFTTGSWSIRRVNQSAAFLLRQPGGQFMVRLDRNGKRHPLSSSKLSTCIETGLRPAPLLLIWKCPRVRARLPALPRLRH
jgi:hypothetical protein